jgi:non-specific serine/threonine protein kinase
VNYDYIILDEAQNIKNAASQTAKAVKTLNSSQRLALTGTPIENHLSELWSIFDFLMPGFLGAQSYFQDYYQVPIEKLSQVETAKHLQNKIKPFVLRRLKKQVLTELPEKTEIATYCEMTDEQKEIYRDIVLQTKKDLMQKIKKEGIEKNQLNILSALLRLRQICCHPGLISPEFEHLSSGKFELFKETISEILEEKHRILVFSQFVSMLTIIKNWAKQNDIPFAYLDGSTKNRQEIIEKFQKEKNASLFLLSLKAGGTGLNLTNADYVVHFDPWWNPAVEDQATDRAHRMGQEKKVFVYKMITKNSVEEKILRLQQDKRKLNESVIVADQSFAKQITKEDLESLFDFEDI